VTEPEKVLGCHAACCVIVHHHRVEARIGAPGQHHRDAGPLQQRPNLSRALRADQHEPVHPAGQ
jgi:hypothetical protein